MASALRNPGTPRPSHLSWTSASAATAGSASPSRGPSARLTSQEFCAANGPSVGASSMNLRESSGADAPAHDPNSASCAANSDGSPGSSLRSEDWKAMSSTKYSAFSEACAVQPSALSRAVWNTTCVSASSKPRPRANWVASRQQASPVSSGAPVARSVVSDRAASTSVARIDDTSRVWHSCDIRVVRLASDWERSGRVTIGVGTR